MAGNGKSHKEKEYSRRLTSSGAGNPSVPPSSLATFTPGLRTALISTTLPVPSAHPRLEYVPGSNPPQDAEGYRNWTEARDRWHEAMIRETNQVQQEVAMLAQQPRPSQGRRTQPPPHPSQSLQHQQRAPPQSAQAPPPRQTVEAYRPGGLDYPFPPIRPIPHPQTQQSQQRPPQRSAQAPPPPQSTRAPPPPQTVEAPRALDPNRLEQAREVLGYHRQPLPTYRGRSESKSPSQSPIPKEQLTEARRRLAQCKATLPKQKPPKGQTLGDMYPDFDRLKKDVRRAERRVYKATHEEKAPSENQRETHNENRRVKRKKMEEAEQARLAQTEEEQRSRLPQPPQAGEQRRRRARSRESSDHEDEELMRQEPSNRWPYNNPPHDQPHAQTGSHTASYPAPQRQEPPAQQPHHNTGYVFAPLTGESHDPYTTTYGYTTTDRDYMPAQETERRDPFRYAHEPSVPPQRSAAQTHDPSQNISRRSASFSPSRARIPPTAAQQELDEARRRLKEYKETLPSTRVPAGQTLAKMYPGIERLQKAVSTAADKVYLEKEENREAKSAYNKRHKADRSAEKVKASNANTAKWKANNPEKVKQYRADGKKKEKEKRKEKKEAEVARLAQAEEERRRRNPPPQPRETEGRYRSNRPTKQDYDREYDELLRSPGPGGA